MTHNNIITIDNFEEELDNIILSKKISNDTSSKYNIYSNKDGKLMNVLIKVPQIRLIYNYSHQIYNQISFPLNPTYQKTKKFSKLINALEDKLQELLNKPKLDWITNLKKIKNIKSIKLNYYGKNNVKIISDDIGISDVKDFSADSEIEIISHVSHIWIKDKKAGTSCNITHIKYNSLEDMFDIDMFDKNINAPKQVIRNPIKRTIQEPSNSRRNTMGIFMPSKEILDMQKSKLKSIL